MTVDEETAVSPEAGDRKKTIVSHRVPKEYRHPAHALGLMEAAKSIKGRNRPGSVEDGRGTAGTDGTVHFWDARAGEQIRRFDRDDSPVRSVVFSPNDGLAHSGRIDGVIRVWRLPQRSFREGEVKKKTAKFLDALQKRKQNNQMLKH